MKSSEWYFRVGICWGVVLSIPFWLLAIALITWWRA